ncbi:unnamed protein product, partial [Ectocarpus fasciculatus]
MMTQQQDHAIQQNAHAQAQARHRRSRLFARDFDLPINPQKNASVSPPTPVRANKIGRMIDPPPAKRFSLKTNEIPHGKAVSIADEAKTASPIGTLHRSAHGLDQGRPLEQP